MLQHGPLNKKPERKRKRLCENRRENFRTVTFQKVCFYPISEYLITHALGMKLNCTIWHSQKPFLAIAQGLFPLCGRAIKDICFVFPRAKNK